LYAYMCVSNLNLRFMVCFRRFFSSNSAVSCLSSLRRCIDNSPSAIPTVTRLSSGCKQCLAHWSLNDALVRKVNSTLSNKVKVKSVLCTKKLSELLKYWHQQFMNISIFARTIICHKIIPRTHVQQTATDLVSPSTSSVTRRV